MLRYAVLAGLIAVPLAAVSTVSAAAPTAATPSAAAPIAAWPASAGSAAPAVVAGTAATTSYADWPTYHGGTTRSGYAITAKRVSVTPKQAWSITLDGAVYAQPIIVDHGIVIAATENNS